MSEGFAAGDRVLVRCRQPPAGIIPAVARLTAICQQDTGLPTRYYVPPQDVRTELLRPTKHETTCPFKGQASYWSAVLGDEVHEDIAWSYQTPIPGAAGIAGLLCFYNERVELAIDGERQPTTA